ncbi:hypothetical protein OBV_24910 [Oscillibacter valericigenes Sjm18-20]|nr:hypothetical protein OBV_24910 [Oscillibacter valericigenes Sjm18-20]
MIYDSHPWKQDLQRRKRLILKYNTAERFDQNDISTYTVVEKSIFYSAFIIRKLLDCGGKLSDEADRYVIKAKSIKPLVHIDLMQRWPEENSHDWEHERNVTVSGKDVCNWLIHSYLFFTESDEGGAIINFCVSSDYDKNKVLYNISMNDWVTYIEYIATDDIIRTSSYYDEKTDDYIYTRKERGVR